MIKKESVYVFFSYVCWGLSPLFWKLLSEVSSLYTLASRFFWGLVVYLIVCICTKHMHAIKECLKDKKQCLWLAGCGVLLAINWGTYILAVNINHILDASLAYFVCPLFSVLIGFLIYKEKLSKAQWAAVVLAFVGIMISIVAYGNVPYLALIMAVTFSLYSAMKKKLTLDSSVSSFMETVFVAPVALVFLIFSEITHTGAIGVMPGAMLFVVPLAGVMTAVPQLLFSKGVNKTPLSLTGIFMYVNPTMQMLIGVLLYKEAFTTSEALTFSFVWAAVILFVASNIRNAKRAEAKAAEEELLKLQDPVCEAGKRV